MMQYGKHLFEIGMLFCLLTSSLPFAQDDAALTLAYEGQLTDADGAPIHAGRALAFSCIRCLNAMIRSGVKCRRA